MTQADKRDDKHFIRACASSRGGSAMSYEADVTRARRLMPIVQEGFAASLTEAATRFAMIALAFHRQSRQANDLMCRNPPVAHRSH
jgi:hypothetical protein